MIAFQRTTRDAAGCILPVLVMFTTILTYISLAAYGFVPIVGTIYSAASWLAPVLSVLLWLFLVRYVYRLIFPVAFRTEVFSDRVVFSDSSKPNEQIILKRRDIARFYIKPRRWWHTEDATYPIVYETTWNDAGTISLNFVYDGIAQDFFRAISEEWGPEYIPAPEAPGLLSREIRLWPRRKADEPWDGPESPNCRISDG